MTGGKRGKNRIAAVGNIAQAQNVRLRLELMGVLKQRVETAQLTQAQAAALFSVTQPRVSDLLRGKLQLFSIDTLVNMAWAAHLTVDLKIAESTTTEIQARQAVHSAMQSSPSDE